jgi:Transglycosylase-like domain/Putative peptidoglycan binding domain
MSSLAELALSERCSVSLRRSRARRQAARRWRRRRLRIQGSSTAFAVAALAVAVLGAGAALGQSVQSSAPAAAPALLAKGSSGPAVSAVQRALGMPADGVYSERTDAAVRRFQRRKGLLVDGIVGPQTRVALGLAPAAAAGGGQANAAGTAPAGVSAPSAALQRIASCESGGNPRAVGGGGRYRGKYQFTPETWRAVGGSGDPAAAPEAEQDRRAQTLYARSGSSSWPTCG